MLKNLVLFFMSNMGVRLIHECDLYSNKYGTSGNRKTFFAKLLSSQMIYVKTEAVEFLDFHFHRKLAGFASTSLIQTLINLNKMQFGFMAGKGTVNAIFIMRRMQEEYQKKDKKLYMCFVDTEKAFNRVQRNVMEWAMRKKGLSKVMVLAVMSLYDGAKIRVRVESPCSEKFEVIWCTSKICAVSTIVCNSCGCLYRKCKIGCGLMKYYMQMTLFA